MVVPSRQEAFGQTVSESLACGTPVVAFGTTGLLDIVDHQINGYFAKPFDVSDLAAGINWVLSDENRHKELCIKAREKAVACCDIKKVAGQYAELYMNVELCRSPEYLKLRKQTYEKTSDRDTDIS